MEDRADRAIRNASKREWAGLPQPGGGNVLFARRPGASGRTRGAAGRVPPDHPALANRLPGGRMHWRCYVWLPDTVTLEMYAW